MGRSSRFVLPLFALCCLLVGPAGAATLGPPHDSSNGIACLDCHALHTGGAFGVTRPRDAAQALVCASCHNPTGQASTMTEVALHVVDGGARTVDCGSCHQVHGPDVTVDGHPGGATAPNLRLVRGDTTAYVPEALEPALFQSRPEQFAFGPADQPWDGVCQSCHTQTRYHTNAAGSDHAHGLGETCTTCHSHRSGFRATCVGCHGAPQDNGDGVPAGGRRAIVPEFPGGLAHAHMRGGTVDDADCLVCHSTGTHADGFVELIDPDDGSLYRFSVPSDLTSDPDLSDFCAACHDPDGAARLPAPMDPFGGGNAPPDVASRFRGNLQWYERYGDQCFGIEGTDRPVNSHHDISDADQAFSGARIECLSCHGAHTAADTQPLGDPDVVGLPWAATTTDQCLRCHGGGVGPGDAMMPQGVVPPTLWLDSSGTSCAPGPGCDELSALRPLDSCEYTGKPWYVDYIWAHEAHGFDSKRGWPGYSGAPPATMECTACHDPHGSFTPDNPAGNPYMIRDRVDGTPLVDDGFRPGAQWTGPPWETFGVVRDVRISVVPAGDHATVDWGGPTGLCSTCHANWEAAYGWHTFCEGCQGCHGHGQAFGGSDFGGGGNDTYCGE